MKEYWKILSKYGWSLILCPILVLIFVICETTQPMLMARIVDDGVMLKDLSVITEIGIYMIIISAIGLIANIINVYISSNTAVGFATDLRRALFNKIQTLSFAEIDKFNSASLITRLTNDITRLQTIVLLGLRLMLRSPMMLIMAFVFVVRINAELSIIIAAAIPILAVAVYFILKRGFPLFIRTQQKVDKLNAVVRENLINIRVVKSFVREKYETDKFEESNEELRDTSIKAGNMVVSVFPIMQLIMNFSVIIILWVGGNDVANGDLKIGELVSLVNYLMQILMSLMMISMIIMNISRASASSERILEVLNTEPSLKNTLQAEKEKVVFEHGNVSFKDVCFRYSNGETNILNNISFEVSQGQTIAVVGATGSGKSTLLQLIPRLYDATAGEVLIDGRNIKEYTLDDLHHQIGMVLQKNVLFSGTIEENIRWGKRDATIEEIIEAAKASQAHDFIMSFPEGYSTPIEREGVNLSGGQKQRICIARSIIAKPKILILDDSTSAVDTETEKRMHRDLKEYLAGTTVFISTQRVRTMAGADMVLILDDGSVESFGTPAELNKSSDIYREIINSQVIE